LPIANIRRWDDRRLALTTEAVGLEADTFLRRVDHSGPSIRRR
jgi:hypothetical protein